MPRKTRKTHKSKTTKTRKRRYRAKGDGRVGDWIKDKARKVGKFLKDNRVLSKGLLAVAPLTGSFAPALVASSGIANAVGLGRTHKHRRRTRKHK
jgi:hypothetical protein